MNKLLLAVVVVLVSACGSGSRVISGSEFSFGNYEYVVIAKPTAETGGVLYGMDVELANLMSRYGFKVIGDKEYAALAADQQGRSLLARMSVSAIDKKHAVLSISFDDAVTGKVGAAATASDKANLYDAGDRSDLFEEAAESIIKRLEREKGAAASKEAK